MKSQNMRGPFDTMDSLVSHSLSFCNRVLSRRTTDFLPNARLCNLTFYPVIGGDDDENSSEIYAASLKEYLDHCRLVFKQ